MKYPDDFVNKVINSDCLEVMRGIPDQSIDMILCDLPYGITACEWDTIISLDKLWKQYKRIIKDNRAIVLTASQPFTTDLINSNREWFRYEWIWIKNKFSGLIKNQPIRAFENIIVFYNKKCVYNEIAIKRTRKEYKLCYRKNNSIGRGSVHRPGYKNIMIRKSKREQWFKKPINILEINSYDKRDGKRHPTQKPEALFKYLIKTYTNENDLVLDNCLGSGTTAVACIELNCRFIGIEISPEYCKIARERIAKARQQGRLF